MPATVLPTRLRGLAATVVLAGALTGLAGCGDDGADVRELEPGCAASGSGSGSASGSETSSESSSESSSEAGSTSEDCASQGSSS